MLVQIKKAKCHYYFFFSGGKNDDCGCADICRLLAALPHLLHCYWDLSTIKSVEIHSANLFSQLLACHELYNVQSHYLLLS